MWTCTEAQVPGKSQECDGDRGKGGRSSTAGYVEDVVIDEKERVWQLLDQLQGARQLLAKLARVAGSLHIEDPLPQLMQHNVQKYDARYIMQGLFHEFRKSKVRAILRAHLMDHSLGQRCLATARRTRQEIKKSGGGLPSTVQQLPQDSAVLFSLHIDGRPLHVTRCSYYVGFHVSPNLRF